MGLTTSRKSHYPIETLIIGYRLGKVDANMNKQKFSVFAQLGRRLEGSFIQPIRTILSTVTSPFNVF